MSEKYDSRNIDDSTWSFAGEGNPSWAAIQALATLKLCALQRHTNYQLDRIADVLGQDSMRSIIRELGIVSANVRQQRLARKRRNAE